MLLRPFLGGQTGTFLNNFEWLHWSDPAVAFLNNFEWLHWSDPAVAPAVAHPAVAHPAVAHPAVAHPAVAKQFQMVARVRPGSH
jgi:hypothetical protein